MYFYFHNIFTQSSHELFVWNDEVHHYNTRQWSNLRVHKWITALGQKSFIYMGTHLWSEVNAELQNTFNTKVFVKKYKKELLQKYYWLFLASCGACTSTDPPYDCIMTLHLKQIVKTGNSTKYLS